MRSLPSTAGTNSTRLLVVGPAGDVVALSRNEDHPAGSKKASTPPATCSPRPWSALWPCCDSSAGSWTKSAWRAPVSWPTSRPSGRHERRGLSPSRRGPLSVHQPSCSRARRRGSCRTPGQRPICSEGIRLRRRPRYRRRFHGNRDRRPCGGVLALPWTSWVCPPDRALSQGRSSKRGRGRGRHWGDRNRARSRRAGSSGAHWIGPLQPPGWPCGDGLDIGVSRAWPDRVRQGPDPLSGFFPVRRSTAGAGSSGENESPSERRPGIPAGRAGCALWWSARTQRGDGQVRVPSALSSEADILDGLVISLRTHVPGA